MTPAGFQRLRMGLVGGSVLLVVVVLWLASGYGLGHDLYTAPDKSFRFQYPGGYTVHYEEYGEGGNRTLTAAAEGTATINAFTVIRFPGWAKTLPEAQRAAEAQAFLDKFLNGHQPQVSARSTVQRPYGSGWRLEAVATFKGTRTNVALEATVHGEDLYLFSIEGADAEILKDPEGTKFFDSLALQ